MKRANQAIKDSEEELTKLLDSLPGTTYINVVIQQLNALVVSRCVLHIIISFTQLYLSLLCTILLYKYSSLPTPHHPPPPKKMQCFQIIITLQHQFIGKLSLNGLTRKLNGQKDCTAMLINPPGNTVMSFTLRCYTRSDQNGSKRPIRKNYNSYMDN